MHFFPQLDWRIMYSKINTALVSGISASYILVEADVSTGMPIFDLVGNISPEVREAKERIKTALHNCGIVLPPQRITINFSPANIRKSGTGFDLAIALGILGAMGLIDATELEKYVIVGELGLNGQIVPVNGVLPIVSDGIDKGFMNFIIPEGNLAEAKLVTKAFCYGFCHLNDVLDFLLHHHYKEIKPIQKEKTTAALTLDFAEVNGQQLLKRTSEIAASGMHNLLFVGPPGSGKTMISERIPTILPELTEKERLELSKIYSVCGLLSNADELMKNRPFRSPHHTISEIGLTGGGSNPKPGEMSLAHCGVLFLDEMTEFKKSTLEVLRQPLEEHKIHLVRGNKAVSFPANFLLLGAMNPCSCGYYPNRQKCRCTPLSLKNYFHKISQPLLDRMDLCVVAEPLQFSDLIHKKQSESSQQIRERVEKIHALQKERYQMEDFLFNSMIPSSKIEKYCPITKEEQDYMEEVFQTKELTGRTYHKILRVARTIADMEEKENIEMLHLSEALCYRMIDKKFWGGDGL